MRPFSLESVFRCGGTELLETEFSVSRVPEGESFAFEDRELEPVR